jgi:hypothetical protein
MDGWPSPIAVVWNLLNSHDEVSVRVARCAESRHGHSIVAAVVLQFLTSVRINLYESGEKF